MLRAQRLLDVANGAVLVLDEQEDVVVFAVFCVIFEIVEVDFNLRLGGGAILPHGSRLFHCLLDVFAKIFLAQLDDWLLVTVLLSISLCSINTEGERSLVFDAMLNTGTGKHIDVEALVHLVLVVAAAGTGHVR